MKVKTHNTRTLDETNPADAKSRAADLRRSAINRIHWQEQADL